MEIGTLCKNHRKTIGKTQKQVADDLNMSVQNICDFENGRNRNLNILLWYTAHGMDLPEGRCE